MSGNNDIILAQIPKHGDALAARSTNRDTPDLTTVQVLHAISEQIQDTGKAWEWG